jgi:hypothetical protein
VPDTPHIESGGSQAEPDGPQTDSGAPQIETVAPQNETVAPQEITGDGTAFATRGARRQFIDKYRFSALD